MATDSVNVIVANQQNKYRIYPRNIARFVSWLIEQLQKRKRFPPGDELSILITDDRGIADIHGKFLGEPKSTDVISFNYQNIPPEPATVAGEIIVNVERAQKFRNASRELALYLAHGCDHISGESDHTPRLRNRMRRRELAWLRQADKLELIHKLTDPERKQVLDG